MSPEPDSAQLRSDQLAALLSGTAPTPTNSRFKPLRMGLLGIWQYGNEVFHFHDGRLILRGRNGSGKTKVLEVTSPFLFDANLSARRLDPFGNNARSMRENLLYDGRTHQIGYVWCEYGRIAEGGRAEYRTIGAGMRARETKSGAPESWYFVSPLRVDVDFNLYDNAERPLDESDLAKRLGGSDDTVFTTAEHYRTKLARELFGLSPQRLHSLVELLIILRRPKLSENLSVDRLKEILSNGLPPIDDELVIGLAKNFDDLKRDEEDLKRFIKTQEEVDLFLDSYRTYARRMTRHITNDVLDAEEKHRKALDRGKSAALDLERTDTAIAEADADLLRMEDEQGELRGRIRALEDGPEMRNQHLLTRLQSDVERAARDAASAKDRTGKAANQLVTAKNELGEVAAKLAKTHQAVAETKAEAHTHASSAGLRTEFESEADRLHTDTDTAQNTLQGYIMARQSAIKETRRLDGERHQAQVKVDRIQATHDDLTARRTTAAEKVQSLETEFDDQVASLSQKIVSWAGQCLECQLTDDHVDELVEAVERIEDSRTPRLADLMARHVNDARTGLFDQRSRMRAELAKHMDDHETVTAEREQAARETDPPPPDPLVPRRDRTGVPGAPLWQLVDFHAEIEDDARAGIEAALLGSGLLDAWVTPDGILVDSESWDTILLPGRADTGTSLANLLYAMPDEAVPEPVVTHILTSIAVIDEKAGYEPVEPWIAPDGRWAIGPLRGRSGQEHAFYIGPDARETARQRKLAEIDARLDSLATLISNSNEALEVVEARLRTLADEQRKQPTDTAVRDVLSSLTTARQHEHQLSEELAKSQGRLDTAQGTLDRAAEAVRAYAAAHLLPATPDRLDTLNSALTDLHVAVERLVGQIGTAALLFEQHGSAEQRASQLTEDLNEQTRQSGEADAYVTTLREELAERTRLLSTGITEALERLNTTRKDLAKSVEASKALTKKRQGLGEKRGALNQEVETASSEAARLREVRQTTLAEFLRARDRGFLRLINADEPATSPDDVADAARVHALLSAEEFDETARNTARNDVDRQFRELQREIEGPDWRPWGDNDGDLFVVQVTFNGADHSVPDLRDVIAGEIDTRGTLVQVEERRLFSEVLLGSMGEHLRQRRLEASRLVKEMDDQLKRHPTASKMRMSIKWEPSAEAGTHVRGAIELLDRGKTNFLAEDARESLIEFLSEQVREARTRAEHGDWKTHLAEALDYRRWSEFELQVLFHDKPNPVKLTDELHKKQSGGEKAAMLQLPMFAAAAAHYADAASTSPRPIYLDEAFAGIDSEMRASCMGLLTGFDLDFVMASHDEWGFHATVPGVMTYMLFRDPDISGVLATPIAWDGTRRHRLEDRSLKTGPPPAILDADEKE
jgi:uncharacterized protein (TIGR02680 family)